MAMIRGIMATSGLTSTLFDYVGNSLAMSPRGSAGALLVLGITFPVMAHEGTSLPYGSFMAGITHPVLGADHFLAMVSVGVVSAQIGGRDRRVGMT